MEDKYTAGDNGGKLNSHPSNLLCVQNLKVSNFIKAYRETVGITAENRNTQACINQSPATYARRCIHVVCGLMQPPAGHAWGCCIPILR